MSTNEARAATLVRALRAGIERDRTTLESVCTADVRAWSPALATSSRDELIGQLERREEAFSDLEVTTTPLDAGGDYACVEWTVTMTHTGTLVLPGMVLEPTGLVVTVRGVTVAEFRDDRICALRQYWDEFTVPEQLGVIGDVPPPAVA
jgi:ketosteroid isomerase-like protein